MQHCEAKKVGSQTNWKTLGLADVRDMILPDSKIHEISGASDTDAALRQVAKVLGFTEDEQFNSLVHP